MELINRDNGSVADLISAIEQARIAVAEGLRGAYGAKVAYASLLNQKWASFDWFDLKHNDSSDEGKAVRKEKEAFYEVLKGEKHSNPHKIWGDIRGYAHTQRYGKPVVDGEQGDGEQGEQGSDNAKHNRSPQLRNLEELTALFKFNRRQDSLSEELKQCQAYIAKALEALGVNVTMIGD
jgi:hypothetical protein